MGQGYKPQPADGFEKLAAQMKDLQRQVDALRNAASIRNSSISGGQGLIVDAGGVVRSSDFDGDIDTNDPGTTGWSLAHGNAAFGSILLRDGIIGDDALQNPVKFVVSSEATTTAWATSTSLVNKATTTLAIPAGYDRALMFCWGTVVFQDTAANRFDIRCTIDGDAGPRIMNLANLTGATSAFHQLVETGVAGGSITCAVQVFTAVATGGQPANQASVGAYAICLKT